LMVGLPNRERKRGETDDGIIDYSCIKTRDRAREDEEARVSILSN
jgi:hypothetical protein